MRLPGELRLISRAGRNITRFFPEILSLEPLLSTGTVLDVEIGAHGAARRLAMVETAIAEDAASRPCTVVAHDALSSGTRNLTALTLGMRLSELKRIVAALPGGQIRCASVRDGAGIHLTEQARRRKLRGVRGKLKGSVYPGRLTTAWIEVRTDGMDDLVIGGFRTSNGRLVVECGAFNGRDFEHSGSFGVPDGLAEEVIARARTLTRREQPFRERIERKLGTFWTLARLVVTVRGNLVVEVRPDLCPTEIHAPRSPRSKGSRAEQRERDLRLQKRLKFSA